MNQLVTYDVATTTPEGRRRLRRVAQVCVDFGQRVQQSVFECQVGDVEFTQLRHQLLTEINTDEDSLRIYRLPSGHHGLVESHGIDPSIDFDGPLVVGNANHERGRDPRSVRDCHKSLRPKYSWHLLHVGSQADAVHPSTFAKHRR